MRGFVLSAAWSTSTIAKSTSGKRFATVFDRVRHQEADGDHEVVVLSRQPREVRNVVGVRLRDEHAPLDPELRLRPLEPLLGEEVEGAVVEPADVGDEADADRRLRRLVVRRRRGRAAVVAAAVRPRSAAGRSRPAQRERREESGSQDRRVIAVRVTTRGGLETRPSQRFFQCAP